MVNPVLTKKKEANLTLRPRAKELFRAVHLEQGKEEDTSDRVPRIKVSELISKMSFYYEKIRNAVDYKDEHLLRKNAIERILKRQIVIEGVIPIKKLNRREIAKNLIIELIRATYLPNNELPESKIDDIQAIVDKYLALKAEFLGLHPENKDKSEHINWLIALAASEIEEKLGRNQVDNTIIQYMYELLVANIELPENSKYREDKEIQIFVGIHRNYFKFDYDMISFLLFKYYNGEWQDPSQEDIRRIAKNIESLHEAVKAQADHPLSFQLDRIIKTYTVYFTILNEVLEEGPREVYHNIKTDPTAFTRQIKRMCERKYKISRSKLWRVAIRSIVYIFITKSVFAVILEVPATQWFGEELNMFALGVNIAFPAILLFLIVMFTRLPSEENTKKIVDGIHEIVFEENKRREPFRLRPPAKRGSILSAIFTVLYIGTFMASVYGIVVLLQSIGFTFVSIVIFLFFLALVSFFGIRIKRIAREYIMVEPRESIFGLLLDFFYIPIVSFGKWLSENFSRVNVFVFVLDFIIEAPFKIFVEIAEEWTKYVRERKEEIY
jgi:hypothetical protein